MADLVGLKATIATLRKLPEKYNKEKKKAQRKAARPVVKAMKRKAPKRTGTLRKSIKVLTHIKSSTTYAGPNYRKGRGARAPHAHLVEYGTHKQAARPFVKPAFEATKRNVAAILEEETKKILKEYKVKYER